VDPFTIKLLHILGAILLFGTGLGTAFQYWMTHRGGDARAIPVVARNVVVADWLFTLPAVVAQPITGLALARAFGHSLDAPWLLGSIALYLLAGACWIPVVVLQIRMARLAREAVASGAPLGADYHRLARIWFWLGWPAFTAVLIILHLMVHKPGG